MTESRHVDGVTQVLDAAITKPKVRATGVKTAKVRGVMRATLPTWGPIKFSVAGYVKERIGDGLLVKLFDGAGECSRITEARIVESGQIDTANQPKTAVDSPKGGSLGVLQPIPSHILKPEAASPIANELLVPSVMDASFIQE
jgi:hypothetical protein